MRVTHVITRLIVGGAQENTVASVLGLHKKGGMQVDLIIGSNPDRSEGSLADQFHEFPQLLTVLPDLVRPVHPWHDVRAFFQLTSRFCSTRPAIVHTHSGKAGILARLAARRAGVPIVIHTIHGPSFGPFQGTAANLLFRNAERVAGRYTDHFVVVANAMTRQYLAAGIGKPEQYTRVFSGFPLEPFLAAKNDPALRTRLGIGPEDFVIGKIARLFKLKGHDDLFTVFQRLRRHHPNLKLLLVGDGPWRERFTNMVQEMGMAQHVIFTGLVPPSEVPRYVGIMDVLAHLSLREGLARALPQALAASKPVAAYDCDGAGEVCLDNETGFLVQPGDLATLEQHLLRLIGDVALRHRLGERGRELVRECFPVQRMVDDLAALYIRLAKARGIALESTTSSGS